MNDFQTCGDAACTGLLSCSRCYEADRFYICNQAMNEPETLPATPLQEQQDKFYEGFATSRRATKYPDKHKDVEWMWTD